MNCFRIRRARIADLFIVGYLMISCGGALPDEQRKEMREKMEMNKIVRVTEVEIMEAAFRRGRGLLQTLEKIQSDSVRLDSFLRINKGTIRFIRPGQMSVSDLERQLMDEYLADKSGALQDNVQKLRDDSGSFDSLLYTKPVVRKRPEGGEDLRGVWSLWFSKKDLVLEASKHK